ncbi:hypothetical protein AB1L42_08720 [Thalassoglobus sp. JC818]|uniref:hypothetical protein n=1 Tax=Thalassoglobus sp. JC818 TaxID=3232136 RepID=UPI00345A2D5F
MNDSLGDNRHHSSERGPAYSATYPLILKFTGFCYFFCGTVTLGGVFAAVVIGHPLSRHWYFIGPMLGILFFTLAYCQLVLRTRVLSHNEVKPHGSDEYETHLTRE